MTQIAPLILSLVLEIFAVNPRLASEPSYNETLDYLKRWISHTVASDGSGVYFKIDSDKKDRCVLRFEARSHGEDGKPTYTTVHKVPLAKLDPQRTEYDDKGVVLWCFEEQNCMPFSMDFHDGNRSGGDAPWLPISGYDPDRNGRISKAFNHLIEICGGHGELF